MSTVITDSEAKKNIAANVTKLLVEKDWSQADLARAVNESPMRISFLIRGERLASAAFLARIAEAFGVEVADLLSPPKKFAKTS